MKFFHITDFDDTIIPKNDTLEGKFAHAAVFNDFIKSNPEISVIYSSGRFCDSIIENINKYNLPSPKYIIGGVGVEIYDYEKNIFLDEWNKKQEKSGFDAEKIKSLLNEKMGLVAKDKSGKLKLYYHYDNAKKSELDYIKYLFKENNINAKAIYAHNKIMDIIPTSTDKGKALTFLLKYEKFNMKNVVISGDSCNDIDMFKLNTAFKIMPSNAEKTLIKKYKYQKNIYFAKNPCSFGIVEGLKTFLNKKYKENI